MKTAWLGIALFMSFAAYGAAPSADPQTIVSRVDQIRNPGDSYSMSVQITSLPDNDLSGFDVSIKGNDKTVVKTTAPARDRGRNLLMLGEDMWAYIPNLKRAVRVSLSQKLTGQAANGDISRMRWSGDYDPKIESQNAQQWVIFLSSKKKGLTYDKVRAWIDKKTFRPVRAEFLSPEGKVLKRASYGGYKQIAGMVRPTEIMIQDALREQEKSTIRILSMKSQKFPDSIFNQNNLSP
jgi:outer membrane lipoprotein-sorting protein